MFANKVVIVTGASSGIGRATALSFAAAGASLVAVARDRKALDALVGETGGAQALAVASDITTDEAPDDIVRQAAARFGGVDVLVNAAGILGTGMTDATTDEQWDRMMALNLRAPFRLMRAAFPQLKQRCGAVVNVSSVNGRRVFPNLAAYNTSKGALDHLTRCAAIDWAPHGVRVNAVNPGVTVTNLHRRGGMNEDCYRGLPDQSEGNAPARPSRTGGRDRVAHPVPRLRERRLGSPARRLRSMADGT